MAEDSNQDAPIRVPLEAIQSSNLQAIGYDPRRLILAVQFNSGDIYHYASVPLETFAEFYGADSKGRYYAANIRGKFTGQKMTGPCPKCGARGFAGETCADCGCATYELEPLPPRHAIDPDARPSARGPQRTLCGIGVRAKELAERPDQVTCEKCNQIMFDHEHAEV
jgi:hypothetical protein